MCSCVFFFLFSVYVVHLYLRVLPHRIPTRTSADLILQKPRSVVLGNISTVFVERWKIALLKSCGPQVSRHSRPEFGHLENKGETRLSEHQIGRASCQERVCQSV